MGERDDAYQQHILGLVHQITGICQKHDIPFAASFHLDDVSTESGDELKVMRLSGCFSEAAFERVYLGRKKLNVKVTLPERGRIPMNDRDETMSGSDALRLVLEKGMRVARRAWHSKYQPGWCGWVSALRPSDFPGLANAEVVRCVLPAGGGSLDGTDRRSICAPTLYLAAIGPVQRDEKTVMTSYVTFEWKPEMDDIIALDWYALGPSGEAAK